MKKKYLVYGVGVVMAFSLVACGSQTQEPDQPVVQQSEPTAQPIEIKAEEPAEQKTEPTILEGEQLTVYFQKAYDIINTVREDSSEEQINREIAYVAKSVTSDNLTKDVSIKLPDDYKDQYIAWRKTQVFTTCEETVYATGEVNIRASWNVESEELGTLSWGDSLTRVGKGIEGTDAENWSMIKLDDGSIAYISSKYLSLTKPAAQQAASTNSGATGSSGSSTSTAPASGDEMATSATPPNVVHKTNGFSNGKSADPNWDPWDTQAKVIYGGSGG